MSFLRRFFRCYACEAKDAELARERAEKNELLDRLLAMINQEFQTKFQVPEVVTTERPPEWEMPVDPEFEPYLQRAQKTSDQLVNEAAERLRAEGREIVPDY